jgi:hypothetical protein
VTESRTVEAYFAGASSQAKCPASMITTRLVSSPYDGIEAGDDEVLADDTSRRIKQNLSQPLTALFTRSSQTRSDLTPKAHAERVPEERGLYETCG